MFGTMSNLVNRTLVDVLCLKHFWKWQKNSEIQPSREEWAENPHKIPLEGPGTVQRKVEVRFKF